MMKTRRENGETERQQLPGSGRCPEAGFTLMELMVVTGVIAVLIGLLFPVLMGARERARIAKARGEVMALQQAWLAFWQTYEALPTGGGFEAMTPRAVAELGGDASAILNGRGIAFMEFDNRHYADGFKDPWGNLYFLDLRPDPDAVTTRWVYQTRVFCGNTAKHRY